MDPLQAALRAFDRYVARAHEPGGGRLRKDEMSSADLLDGAKLPPTIAGDPPVRRRPAKKGQWAGWTGARAAREIEPTRKARAKKASFQGMPILIDRPRGFVQEGKDADGNAWRRLYRYDYGYIPKTEGGDGEGLDVFVGPSADAPLSWWAVQVKEDGSFDEFKTFLGFSSAKLAESCYRMHIPPKFCAGWFPVPVAFIRSLLGLEPRAVIKALTRKAITMTTKNRIQKLAGVSFETVTQALSEALRLAYPPAEAGDPCAASCGPWPTEVYDDRVVYGKDGVYYQESYTFAEGKATLGGNAQTVVRQYVPANGAGNQATAPVTQAAKNTEGSAMAKKKITKAGGADIVALASERLAELAKQLGKGEGQITPEVAAEIGAVVSLLETAQELYSGGAAPEEPAEDDGETDAPLELSDEDMADLAGAAKRSGGIVKMSGAQFLAYSVQEMKAIKSEADPVKKAVRAAVLEKNLQYASLWTEGSFHGATPPSIPVAIVSNPDGPLLPVEVSVNANPANPANNHAAAGGAVVAGGAVLDTAGATGSATFMSKMAEVMKSIEIVRGTKPVPEETTQPAPVAKSEPAAGLWAQSYVDALPDSSFLYVEESAQKNTAGMTLPNYRHFAIRDASGKLSKAQLAQAIKMIPFFGATGEFRDSLLKKAQSLFGLEESIEKSASLAGARGDDGWPADMADPDFMHGRKPAKATNIFGFDNLPEKIGQLGTEDKG